MRQNLIFGFVMAVAALTTGCAGCADMKDGAANVSVAASA